MGVMRKMEKIDSDQRNEKFILNMYKKLIIKKVKKGGNISSMMERLNLLQERALTKYLKKKVQSNG